MPAVAPIWNADLEPGDLSQWGGFETRTNPQASASQRVTVMPMEAGGPLKIKNFMRCTVRPGDKYGGSTGERGMFRQYKNDDQLWRNPGYDSTVTFAIRTAAGYPMNSNVWVGGMEWHQRGGRGGPAPIHHITYADRFRGDALGGSDDSPHKYVDQNYYISRKPGDWYVFALRVLHNVPPKGIYEIWGCHAGVEPGMKLLFSADEIGTMYQLANGTILQNYSLWCLYRDGGPQTVLEIDMAACREYRQSVDALAYLNSLLGAGAVTGLRKKSETAHTYVLEWDPVPGVYGFRYFEDGKPVSWRARGDITEATFNKINEDSGQPIKEYGVLPMTAGDLMTWKP